MKKICNHSTNCYGTPYQSTSYYSWKIRGIADGCKQCVKGEKLVLFVTGLCSRKCFYCPISEDKWMKDKVYANERELKNENNTVGIIEEATLCRAKGAGITGGDPLLRLKRTICYIKLLKKHFGKNFHIHLYTPLEHVNSKSLERLFKAGLDEIRFHPDLDNEKNWNRIALARKFSWSVGIEIPVIPGYEKRIMRLVQYAKCFQEKAGQTLIDFLNLNELEISDTNANKLIERGFKTKGNGSYAVLGSQKSAFSILCKIGNKTRQTRLKVHYCTARLKDRVQLANRIKLRAKSIVLPFEELTKDATILHGVFYLKELVPGFGYQKRIKGLSNRKRANYLQIINKLEKKIIAMTHISMQSIAVDRQKLRIIVSRTYAKRHSGFAKSLGFVPAIVEEYPTWDKMELSVDFL